MDNLGDSRTDYTKSKSIKRITRADKKKWMTVYIV